MNNIIKTSHAGRWRWVNDIVNGKDSNSFNTDDKYTNVYWMSNKLSFLRIFMERHARIRALYPLSL